MSVVLIQHRHCVCVPLMGNVTFLLIIIKESLNRGSILSWSLTRAAKEQHRMCKTFSIRDMRPQYTSANVTGYMYEKYVYIHRPAVPYMHLCRLLIRIIFHKINISAMLMKDPDGAFICAIADVIWVFYWTWTRRPVWGWGRHFPQNPPQRP